DGHDVDALSRTFAEPAKLGQPTVVIAHTIKGKGVSYMEDKLEWHYKSPSDEQLQQALAELKL
ncbi:transketolase, partial [Escherichia coli]